MLSDRSNIAGVLAVSLAGVVATVMGGLIGVLAVEVFDPQSFAIDDASRLLLLPLMVIVAAPLALARHWPGALVAIVAIGWPLTLWLERGGRPSMVSSGAVGAVIGLLAGLGWAIFGEDAALATSAAAGLFGGLSCGVVMAGTRRWLLDTRARSD